EWNKPDSAIIAFEQTLQLQPQNTDAMGKIAMIYGRFLKNYDLAISYAQRAIQIDPNEEGLYENMGIAYAMKGDITNALATFKQGIATLPKSAKLHLNLGITYQNMGDSVRASQAFKRAFELDPNLKR
ncbi:MAG TPA: tetratricopeptide repeat protein, partial [Bacteroidetes bacterium]|nr:tetratricopeptide repeat protein [Bacteroidota bacterium]